MITVRPDAAQRTLVVDVNTYDLEHALTARLGAQRGSDLIHMTIPAETGEDAQRAAVGVWNTVRDVLTPGLSFVAPAFLFVAISTGGLSGDQLNPLCYAAVDLDNQLAINQPVYNPDATISPEASAFHGITVETMVPLDANRPVQALRRFIQLVEAFAGDAGRVYLVAPSWHFASQTLHREARRLGVRVPPRWQFVDFREREFVSFRTLCKRYGIAQDVPHTALNTALAARDVVRAITEDTPTYNTLCGLFCTQ